MRVKRFDDPALDLAAALDQDLPRIARAVVDGRATPLDRSTRARLLAAAGCHPIIADSSRTDEWCALTYLNACSAKTK